MRKHKQDVERLCEAQKNDLKMMDDRLREKLKKRRGERSDNRDDDDTKKVIINIIKILCSAAYTLLCMYQAF